MVVVAAIVSATVNTTAPVNKGVRRISIDTLRNLYEKRTLPPAAELMSRPAAGVAGHVATMAEMGKDLAVGSDLAKDVKSAASAGTGAAAMAACPFMGAKIKQKQVAQPQ